jgi:hypothetical protein
MCGRRAAERVMSRADSLTDPNTSATTTNVSFVGDCEWSRLFDSHPIGNELPSNFNVSVFFSKFQPNGAVHI